VVNVNKKSIIAILISCSIAALFFTKMFDTNDNESFSIAEENKNPHPSLKELSLHSDAASLATQSISPEINIADSEGNKSRASDVIYSSSVKTMFQNLSAQDKEKYKKINKQLFGVMDFNDGNSYQAFLDKGFPSIEDIRFTEEYSSAELTGLLLRNMNSYPHNLEEKSLNPQAISSLNLLNVLEELEIQVRFYLPDYKNGDAFPRDADWPGNKRPSEITEMLKNLAKAYAVVREVTAVEHLARARYQQLNFYTTVENQNITENVLAHLASADRLLAGNDSLLSYVEESYSDNVELYQTLLRTQ